MLFLPGLWLGIGIVLAVQPGVTYRPAVLPGGALVLGEVAELPACGDRSHPLPRQQRYKPQFAPFPLKARIIVRK